MTYLLTTYQLNLYIGTTLKFPTQQSVTLTTSSLSFYPSPKHQLNELKNTGN